MKRGSQIFASLPGGWRGCAEPMRRLSGDLPTGRGLSSAGSVSRSSVWAQTQSSFDTNVFHTVNALPGGVDGAATALSALGSIWTVVVLAIAAAVVARRLVADSAPGRARRDRRLAACRVPQRRARTPSHQRPRHPRSDRRRARVPVRQSRRDHAAGPRVSALLGATVAAIRHRRGTPCRAGGHVPRYRVSLRRDRRLPVGRRGRGRSAPRVRFARWASVDG